ncbi:hypothetical protein I0P70_02720 [Pontibacter sp. FD36]|uniref:hypothetical protein n=1 Tax=Pontibacter sp. FD36 TaxID=2789860 RepID=UPI0018A97D12|nr:hypothetical protein [Pontibacter sp. FD36]MBF8962147.1 hypothetical protein [Pontibacter sp. FD36]
MSKFIPNIKQTLKESTPLSTLKDDVAFNAEEQARIAKLLKPLIEIGNNGDEKLNKTLNKLLRQFIWNATEYSDEGSSNKYVGQPYWSEAAILLYLEKKLFDFPSRFKSLRHEHSMPINLIVQIIKDKPDAIAETISKYARAVIVTEDEDRKIRGRKLHNCLSDDFATHGNLLCRYTASDVSAIYDVRKIELINRLITSNKRDFISLINEKKLSQGVTVVKTLFSK